MVDVEVTVIFKLKNLFGWPKSSFRVFHKMLWKTQNEQIHPCSFGVTSRCEGAYQVALVVKNLPASAGDLRDAGLIPCSGRSPWNWAWQPTTVFLPEESGG